MKAIILAAGIGRRLESYLGGEPKCLLVLDGEPLLGLLLDSLGAAGVTEAVIVIGHRADRIRDVMGDTRGSVHMRYVVNPSYRKGSILSLWTARAELTDDLLVMDADVLCAPQLIARLVQSRHANCLLLDASVTPTGEEQILMARDGRVHDIAKTRDVDPMYDTTGESVGFLKVAGAAAPILREVVEAAVAAGRADVEYEQAFPAFMQRCVVGYERIDGAPWIEIDFREDVERARREVLPRLRPQSE